MHFNHEYQLRCAQRLLGSRGGAVLDFGCGRGEVVVEGLRRGLDFWGADVYAEGGYGAAAEDTGLLGGRIRRIEGGVLPFEAGTFDLVITNQVLEHVHSLGDAIAEIRRVLKQGGVLLACFPGSGCIYESHVELPLVHRLPHGRIRSLCVATLVALGLGTRRKPGRTRAEHVRVLLGYLDHDVIYRSPFEIERLLRPAFDPVFIEEDWLRERLARTPALTPLSPLASWAPFSSLSRRVVRAIAGETVLLASAQ